MKKKAEETKIQKAAREARDAYAAASETAGKPNATAQHKAAAEHAKARMVEANAAENRERFVKYANGRVSKVVKGIGNVGAIFNPKSFKFNKDDADKITVAIDSAVENLKALITAALAGAPAKERTTFSLD